MFLRRGKGDEDKDATPTAVDHGRVGCEAAPVQDVASAYGVVQADPAGSVTVAAPKAAIVLRMLVRSGETVSAGQALVELANAPGSELAYKQAVDGAAFAKADLARVQRLYDPEARCVRPARRGAGRRSPTPRLRWPRRKNRAAG